MNYFAHGMRFLDRPYFLAGTCAPDWLSAFDRNVRLRTKSAAPVAEGADPIQAEFARGVMQHLADDDWFHGTRAFAEVTGEMAVAYRSVIGADHPTPCSFLGHIVTEMLMDTLLIESNPGALDRYYEALAGIDPLVTETAVNACAARGQTTELRNVIPMFLSERFLADYLDPVSLSIRLNQVLRRVRLTPLPEDAVKVLRLGRQLVSRRLGDLLPPDLFPPSIESAS
jgi:hypothetical protein